MSMPSETRAGFLRDEWRRMQRRLVAHLAEPRSSDLCDRPLTLAASVYTDPARFEAEKRTLFRHEPLLVGFSSELPEAGDRLLFDEAGPPVLVLRAADGGLRAFLNLCPHRGSRLVRDCERSRRLTCPLHAWSFDLEGSLASLPQASAFEGMERGDRHLVGLPVAESAGMIFVRAEPGRPIDVAGLLGPIAPLLEALDLGRLEQVRLDRIPVRTNWKLALDTFSETYHVPTLHRDSLAKNLYSHVALFDHYGRHHRYSGPGLDFGGFMDRPESEWPSGGYQAVHYLFPNTTIAFTHAFDGTTPVVSMFRLFPGETVGETVTIGSTYRRRSASGESGASDEEVSALHELVLDIVRSEDYRVAEDGWSSLVHAPPGFRLVLGRNEALLQHYHRDIAAAIGMALP